MTKSVSVTPRMAAAALAPVLFGLYGGLRREEIACARWDAIDGDWITVVGKEAKTRTIPRLAVSTTRCTQRYAKR